MYCIPTCQGCRTAGVCPKGEAPAAPIPEPSKQVTPRWPDALSYTRLTCGCRCPLIPTTLGRLQPTGVLCDEHGWQVMPKGWKDPDPVTDDPSTLF